jgi:hypothetical protein
LGSTAARESIAKNSVSEALMTEVEAAQKREVWEGPLAVGLMEVVQAAVLTKKALREGVLAAVLTASPEAAGVLIVVALHDTCRPRANQPAAAAAAAGAAAAAAAVIRLLLCQHPDLPPPPTET